MDTMNTTSTMYKGNYAKTEKIENGLHVYEHVTAGYRLALTNDGWRVGDKCQ